MSRGALVGFWLAVLSRRLLLEMEFGHALGWEPGGFSGIDYSAPGYTGRGLWAWEIEAIELNFPPTGRLLLLSAGTGREVKGLTDRGYVVDAFECNDGLLRSGNEWLKAVGVDATIEACDPDVVPSVTHVYDGAIVGWSAYMLIPDRHKRVALLEGLARAVTPGGPILLSFYLVDHHSLEHKVTFHVARAVASLTRQRRPTMGDSLAPTFVHYFTRQQVVEEMEEAGLEMVFLGSGGYGRAVGQAGSRVTN